MAVQVLEIATNGCLRNATLLVITVLHAIYRHNYFLSKQGTIVIIRLFRSQIQSLDINIRAPNKTVSN